MEDDMAAERVVEKDDCRLSAQEAGRIVSFLGYGNPCNSVWFIGIEEGLGGSDPQKARKNLKARAGFETTMDLYKAHYCLQKNGDPIDITTKPPDTQVWQYMAKIMRAYNGNKDWVKLDPAKDYIRQQLGRRKGQTFLTELSPVPSGKVADKHWLAYLREIDPEIEVKLEERNRRLKQLTSDSNPKLIICYGSRADEFARLLGVKWQQAVCPKVRASNDSKCLLLPFFGNGQISHKVIECLFNSGMLRKSGSPTSS